MDSGGLRCAHPPGKKNAPGQKLQAKGDAQERETVR